MVRTQIYLTKEERQGLDAVARSTGKKQSELIREAVDRFLQQSRGRLRGDLLKRAAGMWRNRTDLLDFRALRKEWDRAGSPLEVRGMKTKAETSDILAAIRDVRKRKR